MVKTLFYIGDFLSRSAGRKEAKWSTSSPGRNWSTDVSI